MGVADADAEVLADPLVDPEADPVAVGVPELADDVPEVVQCSLAPVIAAKDAAHVLSASVRLAPATSRHGLGARRLRGL